MSAEATDVEQKARDIGWVPKDQFSGDPALWIDAEAFVRKGEELMPLLKHDKRMLEKQVAELRTSHAAEIAAIRENVQELVTASVQQTQAAAERELKVLRSQLAEARQSGDTAQEIEIEERIDDAKERVKEAKAKAAAPRTPRTVDGAVRPVNPALADEIAAFKQRNPWYETDEALTAAANAIGQKLMGTPEWAAQTPRQRLDALAAEMNRKFNLQSPRQTTSKVEGSAGGTDARPHSGARTYTNLPPEAKAQVDKDAKRFVGKGKAFETIEKWRDHFVSQYDWNAP